MRAIALVSDAYGGRGGIALYNRNFLKAVCEYHNMSQVVALPRVITYELEQMPDNLSYITRATGSKIKYLQECVKLLFEKKVNFIICSHLHLLPFAYLLKVSHKCPVIPLVYGVEAWTPTPYGLVNFICSKIKFFISIRKLTSIRFKHWANLEHTKSYYLPNCISENQYTQQPKRQELLNKFNLKDKQVLITTGRLDCIDLFDIRNGFDEILEVLPDLRKIVPNIAYLIIGDGEDKERLLQKAKDLNVADIVRFSGYVKDVEKADYYRLGDVFAMPGSNPLFDRYPFRFVFLEALACGLPVVGCNLNNDVEGDILLAQQLIVQVDPNDKDDIIQGVLKALKVGKGFKPGIENFYCSTFNKSLHKILDSILV